MKKFIPFLFLGFSTICTSEAFGMIINVNKRTINKNENDISQNFEEYVKKRENITYLSKVKIESEAKIIDENINKNHVPNPRQKELKKFYKTYKTPKKPLKSSYEKNWEE